MTFTATRRLGRLGNGSLTVPARCGHTDGSSAAFSDFCKLSYAVVLGKRTSVA